MQKSERKVFLSLTGGLGNQLFQLAAGLNLAGGGELSLVTELSAPRKSKNGKADLLSFCLPKELKPVRNKNANWITRKTAGFMLRNGFSPNRLEKNIFFVFLSQFFANFVMTIFLRSKVVVVAASDVGYCPMPSKKPKILLLGYFQSYRWASEPEILYRMKSIKFSQNSEVIEKYSTYAELEFPLVVHVRLGDYLSEDNFGIPSKDYYKAGIDEILSTEKCKSIWLFSDDLEKAREYIPNNISIPIRMIPDIEDSAAATLEVMRLGTGYVIANSTFSWWAAFLSKEQAVEVVAPRPWFQGMVEPSDLIPPNWKRIDAGFQGSTIGI
jgi:hypothetical protein